MMKRIFLLLITVVAVTGIEAQPKERFSFATSVGTGIALSTPKSTPFEWQVVGYYRLNRRFSAGIGTGVSVYEKTSIPLFADVRFALTKPRKFTPFWEWAAGYGFAPGKDVNGGFFLNPSLGVQCKVCGRQKVFIALGYEIQKLERLKKYEFPLFTAEFAEKLNHRSISVKAGLVF